MIRLGIIDLEGLFDKAPAKAGASYHPRFLIWLIRAVKHGFISEDREGFYLTQAQQELWLE